MILKGIDKGDVVGSGAPQITRDGSMGRNPADFLQSRRNKPGTFDIQLTILGCVQIENFKLVIVMRCFS